MASSRERGSVLAPKTVAWDPSTDAIWVSTDVLPERKGPGGHPTIVLNFDGSERARIDDVEVQYARFLEDGTGYFAVASGRTLKLASPPPAGQGPGARRRTLDHAGYPISPGSRFRPGPPSQRRRPCPRHHLGRAHFLGPSRNGPVPSRSSTFLDPAPDGLYYSAAVRAERAICATYCAGLSGRVHSNRLGG